MKFDEILRLFFLDLKVVLPLAVILLSAFWGGNARKKLVEKRDKRFATAVSAEVCFLIAADFIAKLGIPGFELGIALVILSAVATYAPLATILAYYIGGKRNTNKNSAVIMLLSLIILALKILDFALNFNFKYVNVSSISAILLILLAEAALAGVSAPKNTFYVGILEESGIPMKVVGKDYKVVYGGNKCRDDYNPLAVISLSEPYEADRNTLVTSTEIENGYALTEHDVYDLRTILSSLRQSQKKLDSYAMILDKEGEISEKLVSLKTRNKLYEFALRVVPQKIALAQSLTEAIPHGSSDFKNLFEAKAALTAAESAADFYEFIDYEGESVMLSAYKFTEYIQKKAELYKNLGIECEVFSSLSNSVNATVAFSLLAWFDFILEKTAEDKKRKINAKLTEQGGKSVLTVSVENVTFKNKFEVVGSVADVIKAAGGTVEALSLFGGFSASLSFPKGGAAL